MICYEQWYLLLVPLVNETNLLKFSGNQHDILQIWQHAVLCRSYRPTHGLDKHRERNLIFRWKSIKYDDTIPVISELAHRRNTGCLLPDNYRIASDMLQARSDRRSCKQCLEDSKYNGRWLGAFNEGADQAVVEVRTLLLLSWGAELVDFAYVPIPLL